MSTLADRLAGKRVIICAGAGGVGKTTVSATVALGLAAGGRRVAVVTIDPARRLAEALGLDRLGNEPRLVDPGLFSASGLQMGGELWAMMLDAKRTFDDLIARLAPDVQTRDEILANPIYRHISGAVAGSQEYTAIAKLFELEHESDFDVIVLDTPPSRNALDFLDAPERLTGFLESRALTAFLAPTRYTTRIVGVAFAALRRVTGVGLLEDLSTFFELLSGLVGGFRERASDVRGLLTDPATAFLVVTSPERAAIDEAIFFAAELDRKGMHRCGLIVNRVHPLELDERDTAVTTARLAPALGARLAGEVARTHADVQLLARRDAAAVERLRGALHDADPISLTDRTATCTISAAWLISTASCSAGATTDNNFLDLQAPRRRTTDACYVNLRM
ncbi:MAG: AAA family ATPase [Actinomycetota bacterium]|nr:AAA family ATPase [Actinomycetota bacterium]